MGPGEGSHGRFHSPSPRPQSKGSQSPGPETEPLLRSSGSGADVALDVESPDSRRTLPREPHKLISVLVFFLIGAGLNDVVLSWVHERVSRDPMPDLFFDWLPYRQEALAICEYILIVWVVLAFVLCLFHSHRWILFRRVFFIAALLYWARCITMAITSFPVADPNYYCSPKLNESATFGRIVLRGLKVLGGFGLSVAGEQSLCGDYMYSGHTVILVLAWLQFAEYSPRRWWPAHWVGFLGVVGGIACLLLSRGHYSIDCLVAYFATTRLFWHYHTLANHPPLRDRNPDNPLSRSFWFWPFRWLEAEVTGPVPRRFSFPLPLPTTLGPCFTSR